MSEWQFSVSGISLRHCYVTLCFSSYGVHSGSKPLFSPVRILSNQTDIILWSNGLGFCWHKTSLPESKGCLPKRFKLGFQFFLAHPVHCQWSKLKLNWNVISDVKYHWLQVTSIINPVIGCHYFPLGLRLPSQSQSITALWPVPTCTAWWQMHKGCKQLAQGCCLITVTGRIRTAT